MNDKKKNQVINNMLRLYSDLQEELAKNKQEISNIQYYKDFQFNGTNLGKYDVYIVKIKDNSIPEKNEEYLHKIYDKDNNLIAKVDKEGKIQFEEEFLETIDDKFLEALELENAEFKLPEELEINDLILSKEELEEKQSKKEMKDISKIIKNEKIHSYSTMKVDQTPKFEKITNKQEIDPDIEVTQTETLSDMIPEIREKGIVKVGVVYSNRSRGQNGMFTFVGIDKDGQIQKIDTLQNIEGTTTGQTVTSINSRDGSLIEEKQVAGMVRINGRGSRNGEEEMLSVRVGQYGILEVDYVRADLSKDKDDRYLSAPIETKNQKPTTREVRELMDRNDNTEIDDELDKAKAEIDRDGDTKIQNIDDTAYNDYLTPDDIIILSDGSKTTLRKEAQKAKVSPEEFTRKYNEEVGGNTPDEKINKIHEDIEEEFGTPTKTI